MTTFGSVWRYLKIIDFGSIRCGFFVIKYWRSFINVGIIVFGFIQGVAMSWCKLIKFVFILSFFYFDIEAILCSWQLTDSAAHIFGYTWIAIFFIPKFINFGNIVSILFGSTFLIIWVSGAWDWIFLHFNRIFKARVLVGLNWVLFLRRSHFFQWLCLMNQKMQLVLYRNALTFLSLF